MSFSIPMSFLFMAVLVVVCLGAKKKMVWVDANAYVATMKNTYAGWNIPSVNYPGGSMGTNLLIPTRFSFLAREKSSISLPADWSIPKPTTRVWFMYNKLHETVFHRANGAGAVNTQLNPPALNCIKTPVERFSKNLSGSNWIKLMKDVVIFFSPRLMLVHLVSPFLLYSTKLICIVGRFLHQFGWVSNDARNVYTLVGEEV
jgi:hypothetical protein